MNPTTLKLGYRAARKAWSAFNDYREKHAAEFYDTLQNAAHTAVDKGSELVENTTEAISGSELVERGTAVQKQAARRLEESRKHAGDYRKQAEEAAKKSGKQLREAAREKAQRRARSGKKAKKDKKKSKRCCVCRCIKKVLSLGAITALIAAVGAAVYYIVFGGTLGRNKDDAPDVTPPRVDNGAVSPDRHTGDDDVLVYSTETPEGTEVHRDEKLIDEVNAQLDALEKEIGVGEPADDPLSAHVESITDPRAGSEQAKEIQEAENAAAYNEAEKTIDQDTDEEKK